MFESLKKLFTSTPKVEINNRQLGLYKLKGQLWTP